MNGQDIIQSVKSYIALDGQMVVIASDGAYLGVLSSDLSHPESISNPQGNYGSIHSTTSTQNPHSMYLPTAMVITTVLHPPDSSSICGKMLIFEQ